MTTSTLFPGNLWDVERSVGIGMTLTTILDLYIFSMGRTMACQALRDRLGVLHLTRCIGVIGGMAEGARQLMLTPLLFEQSENTDMTL